MMDRVGTLASERAVAALARMRWGWGDVLLAAGGLGVLLGVSVKPLSEGVSGLVGPAEDGILRSRPVELLEAPEVSEEVAVEDLGLRTLSLRLPAGDLHPLEVDVLPVEVVEVPDSADGLPLEAGGDGPAGRPSA